MCISKKSMTETLNDYSRKQAVNGVRNKTLAEWQGLVDDYVNGRVNEKEEKRETEEIYQMFSIQLMMKSFSDYLQKQQPPTL